MGICFTCYWGWPIAIADIYEQALSDLDGYADPLSYGPGHVVWEDENFDQAEYCLEHFDEYRGDYTDEQLAIVRLSLEKLAMIPIEERECEPEDYDDENPELFSPTRMVRKV